MSASLHMAKKSIKVGDWLAIVVLVLFAAFMMFPVLWGFFTALKPDNEINVFPPTILPQHWTLSNFYKVIHDSIFSTYFFNSIIVTGIVIVVATMVAAHAAFALSTFKIKYTQQIMFVILMTSMVPPIALLTPLYMLSVKVGLFNTKILLILIYTAWRIPILTWILYGFFKKLPQEILEAGIIDGCTKPMAFYWLILPISRPGLVAAALLSAVYVWNDFLVSFTFVTDEKIRMLSVGLYQYITQYGIQWGELMAAVSISIIPVIVLFILLQRNFVEGLAAGAVKG